MQRVLEEAKAYEIFSEEKWRHEQAEITQEAQEAYEAYEAYKEEQKRRAVTEREDWERERGTLGEYYPAPAPGCWKTRMTSDWYDDDRRSPGQFFWNRGLENKEHYGAGRCSSWCKSAEEQEITNAEADRAVKIYRRRRFFGG